MSDRDSGIILSKCSYIENIVSFLLWDLGGREGSGREGGRGKEGGQGREAEGHRNGGTQEQGRKE